MLDFLVLLAFASVVFIVLAVIVLVILLTKSNPKSNNGYRREYLDSKTHVFCNGKRYFSKKQKTKAPF